MKVADEVWTPSPFCTKNTRESGFHRRGNQSARTARELGHQTRFQCSRVLPLFGQQIPLTPQSPNALEDSRGRKRLYHPGDPYHSDRKNGKIHPEKRSSAAYQSLVDWYDACTPKLAPSRSATSRQFNTIPAASQMPTHAFRRLRRDALSDGLCGSRRNCGLATLLATGIGLKEGSCLSILPRERSCCDAAHHRRFHPQPARLTEGKLFAARGPRARTPDRETAMKSLVPRRQRSRSLFASGPEPGKLEQLLADARRRQLLLFMSVLNLGEVFYLTWQRRAKQKLVMLSPTSPDCRSRLSQLIFPIPESGRTQGASQNPLCRLFGRRSRCGATATLVTSDHDFENSGATFRFSGWSRLNRAFIGVC